MGAWVTDYVAYWAGHEGFVRYSNASYRGPAYEGDVTYLDAEITELLEQSVWGAPLVRLDVKMTNQDGGLLAKGTADVELPR
jgi:hypothetical protein